MNPSAARSEGASPTANSPIAPLPYGFLPRVRLYVERVTVDRGDLLCPKLSDVEMPVLAVTFDYGDGVVFRACPPEVTYSDDREDAFFVATDGAAARTAVARDLRGEARAAALVESFGAVELGRGL